MEKKALMPALVAGMLGMGLYSAGKNVYKGIREGDVRKSLYGLGMVPLALLAAGQWRTGAAGRLANIASAGKSTMTGNVTGKISRVLNSLNEKLRSGGTISNKVADVGAYAAKANRTVDKYSKRFMLRTLHAIEGPRKGGRRLSDWAANNKWKSTGVVMGVPMLLGPKMNRHPQQVAHDRAIEARNSYMNSLPGPDTYQSFIQPAQYDQQVWR